MEEEGGGGPRLSKRFPDKFGGSSSSSSTIGGGEVDYKMKAGTAWSHNYLNQKPWHPLSYPNQRRKWIAEQTHAQKQRRGEEVSREFAQEQEFFRQTALVSSKEKEKMELIKSVSFMYVRPPGYNAESAKAAEIADEKRQQEQSIDAPDPIPPPPPVEIKKKRPKDVFGRALPTEEEFEVLKNAPRLETGAPARVKPFAVEIRNVRCVRCGTYGHQSGDRECPLKDVIMPNEESRLKRDDPLTAIMAQTDSGEPLKWELKQRPGMSPPRGGFRPEDPNQQIVAEDIFDEYGGFLSGGNIPALLTEFKKAKKHSRKKSKHKKHPSNTDCKFEVLHDSDSSMSSDSCDEREKKSLNHKRNRQHKGDMHESPDYDHESKNKRLLPDSERDNEKRMTHSKHKRGREHENKRLSPSSGSDSDDNRRISWKSKHERQHISKRSSHSSDSDNSGGRKTSSRSKHEKERRRSSKKVPPLDSESVKERWTSSKSKNKARQHGSKRSSSSDPDSGYEGRRTSLNRKYKGKHHTKRRSVSSSSDSDERIIRSSKNRTEKDRCHVSRKHTYDESHSDHRLDRRKRRHV